MVQRSLRQRDDEGHVCVVADDGVEARDRHAEGVTIDRRGRVIDRVRCVETVTSSTSGWLMPCIVRFPSMVKAFVPCATIFVLTKVHVGKRLVSKNWGNEVQRRDRACRPAQTAKLSGASQLGIHH
jgi:hypothetical protein